MNIVSFRDLGRMTYEKAWDYQKHLFREIQQQKRSGTEENHGDPFAGTILFVEHPHVYTIGKSGNLKNLLVPEDKLNKEEIGLYHIDRGGDITYHGPGQIVGYPILNLDILGIGVKKYIYLLEEAVISTLALLGLTAKRLDGATGVWMHTGKNEMPRKICAIGVRVSRGVTMHGFAFNINTGLQYFTYINPCGFTDKGVTSVEQEMGKTADINQVKAILKEKLYDVFSATAVKEETQ